MVKQGPGSWLASTAGPAALLAAATAVAVLEGVPAKARGRGPYDESHQAELTVYMQRHGAHYDVVASADTLVYLGALDEAMRAAACALRPGGYLCFTVEALTIMVIHATPEHERRASP